MGSQENLKKYLNQDVVSYYDTLEGLSEAEIYLFDKYIPKEKSILDLGVGGGRTTAFLSERAARYVGVDYAETMIELCRSKFSDIEFQVGDASQLTNFQNNSFETVVFSFNGIDAIESDEARTRCLNEIKRVLKPGGNFIFSVHNSKSMLVCPQLKGARVSRKIWRVFRAIFVSIQMSFRRIFQKAFWHGQGYINDPVHGGMKHHVATADMVLHELKSQGFESVETIPGNYPLRPISIAVPWYYFCFTKKSHE